MLRASVGAFVYIVAAVAAVVAVAKEWGIYPIGVIVLLGCALVGALWAGVVAARRHGANTTRALAPEAEPGARRHDARIVADVREMVTRQKIIWLREHDFGQAWRSEYTNPLYDLDRLNDVEYVPIDPELAAALKRLLETAGEFAELHAVNSFPDKRKDDWRDTGWSDVEGGKYGKHREIFDERRKLLNDASVTVADAYDEFIDIARRKLLLDTSQEDESETAI